MHVLCSHVVRGGPEEVSSECFTMTMMMMMMMVSKQWTAWFFSGLRIYFCLHWGFLKGQIWLREAVESGSRGTEGEYPAFLLITSVWESYAHEKSSILIGKCTHLEIRVYVSSPAKLNLGLGLQFPRQNIFSCTHAELPGIMILGVRLKSSPSKLSSRSRGPSGAEMRDELTGREGLSEAELTVGIIGVWPPMFETLPLILTVLHLFS